MKYWAPVAVALLCAFTGTHADIVFFKNGQYVKGKILQQNDTEIRIEAGSGVQTIPRSSVLRVEVQSEEQVAREKTAIKQAETDRVEKDASERRDREEQQRKERAEAEAQAREARKAEERKAEERRIAQLERKGEGSGTGNSEIPPGGTRGVHSLLIPGWGQRDRGDRILAPAYLGGAAFLFLRFWQSRTELGRAQTAYSDPVVPGLLSVTPGGAVLNVVYFSQLRDDLFRAQRNTILSFQLLGLFWAWNVFDAAYFGPGGSTARDPRTYSFDFAFRGRSDRAQPGSAFISVTVRF